MASQAEMAAARRQAEYAARWSECPGCHLSKPLNPERSALAPHRRYVEVRHAPGELPGLMIGCSGAGLPPAEVIEAMQVFVESE